MTARRLELQNGTWLLQRSNQRNTHGWHTCMSLSQPNHDKLTNPFGTPSPCLCPPEQPTEVRTHHISPVTNSTNVLTSYVLQISQPPRALQDHVTSMQKLTPLNHFTQSDYTWIKLSMETTETNMLVWHMLESNSTSLLPNSFHTVGFESKLALKTH